MTTSTVHLYSNHISLNGTTDTPSTEIKAKGLHMTYCIKEKKNYLYIILWKSIHFWGFDKVATGLCFSDQWD